MSLNWLRQKLIQSKAIDPCFGIQALDLKNDESIPKRLRDSLISETSEDHQQVGYDPIQDSCDSESETETWEATRQCQDGCNHIGCFPINLTETEIFIAPKRETSSCTVSLIPNSSSISLVATNECDNRDFLSITYLVPLRIIHWKFNSNYSLRGFNVKSFRSDLILKIYVFQKHLPGLCRWKFSIQNILARTLIRTSLKYQYEGATPFRSLYHT